MTDSGGVAIIGCGWAGHKHADAFIAEGARLRWAVDVDPLRAAGVAALQPGARQATSLEEPLSDPAVNMFDVCVPHYLHAETCLAAIAEGKDVLCEKPLAPSLADADRMAEAAEEAGTLLMVAENECFNPMYREIASLLAAGVIGEPALVQATRECYLRESFVHDRRWFLSRDAAGGGILLAGAVHDFAKLRMMLGEVVVLHSLRARQRFAEMEAEDTVVTVLGFEGGAVGTLVESFFMIDPTTTTGAEVHRLRIDGDKGSIEVTAPQRLRVTTLEAEKEVTVTLEDTFRAEIREFLTCVASRREPATSARAQRRNLELVEAAYASIASGQPVRL
ncbi:MAG TPA: Gfo/Idh/MocA family oxidoreductase [Acidimicrobiales bacterium]|nr:Gfo/Idh/MocA family oxidoreductase [Acidimicrobiales bacterium]